MNAKKYFEAFLAGILTLKTVLQSAPEHDIFIQRIENFGDWNTPSHNHYRRRIRRLNPRAFFARPLPPLQNPRHATAWNGHTRFITVTVTEAQNSRAPKAVGVTLVETRERERRPEMTVKVIRGHNRPWHIWLIVKAVRGMNVQICTKASILVHRYILTCWTQICREPKPISMGSSYWTIQNGHHQKTHFLHFWPTNSHRITNKTTFLGFSTPRNPILICEWQ